MKEANFNALLPAEMAEKAQEIGVAKSKMRFSKIFTLAILAGAFIGLGAIFATTVTTNTQLPWGISKLISGLSFSLGLVLVIVGGAELFTGNNLIVIAWANKKSKTVCGITQLGNCLCWQLSRLSVFSTYYDGYTTIHLCKWWRWT